MVDEREGCGRVGMGYGTMGSVEGGDEGEERARKRGYLIGKAAVLEDHISDCIYEIGSSAGHSSPFLPLYACIAFSSFSLLLSRSPSHPSPLCPIRSLLSYISLMANKPPVDKAAQTTLQRGKACLRCRSVSLFSFSPSFIHSSFSLPPSSFLFQKTEDGSSLFPQHHPLPLTRPFSHS